MYCITGTMVWYYYICKREVWLMSRNILPNQWDENIDYGRFLHENSFKKLKKEISFGNVKFDLVYTKNGQITIGETKKSSKYFEASKMQLLYYLRELSYAGIVATGFLHYPAEKKKIQIFLDNNSLEKLSEAEFEIDKILNSELPPLVNKINFCKKCGYSEYCYS